MNWATDSVVKQNINKHIPLLNKTRNHLICMYITFNKKVNLNGIEKIEYVYSPCTMSYLPYKCAELADFGI
jgi:hypothetical protein